MSVTNLSVTERIATKAATFDPVRVLLTVLAAPFYAIGILVGAIWVVCSWVFAAVALGVQDARGRRGGRET